MSAREKAERIIRQGLIEECGVEERLIVPEARFREDLSIDSLDGVELAMRVEGEIGQNLEDSEIENLKTVGDAIDLLTTKLEAAS